VYMLVTMLIIYTTSTPVRQSQTVQTIAEDPSIWCMGPRHLVTFLLESHVEIILLTTAWTVYLLVFTLSS